MPRGVPESAERTFVSEPDLPETATASALDADARRDLRGLQKDTAEKVAQHLVAAGMLVDEDPERALEHARYARRRAARIAVVREAAGIVAYHAGEWNEALGEFRAARRMGGGAGHLPVMADIERALGRPERALDLARGPEARDLGPADRIELLIVAAGARRDLGETDASVVALQVPELEASRRDPWSARLFYAYADNLLAADRRSEAVQWFVHAYDADTEQATDAAARIGELTGDLPPGADDEDDFAVGEEELSADEVAELVAAAEAASDREPASAVEVDDGPVDGGSATAEGGEDADPTAGAAVHAAMDAEAPAARDEMPADEASADDVAADDVPADDVATGDMPADDVPADDVATGDMPADDMSADDVAADEVAADEVAADDVAADEVVADDAGADEASVDEVAADEVAVDESPADAVAAAETGTDAGGDAVVDTGSDAVVDTGSDAVVDTGSGAVVEPDGGATAAEPGDAGRDDRAADRGE